MKKSIAIVGGGPAALALAAFLDTRRYSVAIYEQNKAVGRKFLVAGKGGFNLTHSESLETFTERYTPADFLRPALRHFSNEDLRSWLASLGLSTFVGSSRRVYPVEGTKPITVLNHLLKFLQEKQVAIHTNATWTGWGADGTLLFADRRPVTADYHVFALGGGSWKITGSDGQWLPKFAALGVTTKDFQAANCAYQIKWPANFIKDYEGQPLKNITISSEEKKQMGEAVITRFGLEGNAIYALSPQIQGQLDRQPTAQIFLDLKPPLTTDEVRKRIEQSKQKSTSSTLRKVVKLSTVKTQLLRTHLTKEQYLDPVSLSHFVKQLPLKVHAPAPLDEAISTTGGIALSAVTDHYELREKPGTFCLGEMLDWNAPTGGYLLQACFSMGAYLANHFHHQG